MVGNNEETRARRMSMDSEFKKLIKDKYILSTILMGCVEEFEGMDMGQTISCLDVQDDLDIVKTRDTEFITGAGEKVIMDSVFEVKLPNDEVLGIVVNIEAQGSVNTGYPLLNRAGFYISELVVDQKGKEFSRNDYGHMKKVVSIWCILNPPAAQRNTVIEYRTEGHYRGGLSSSEPIAEYDLTRLILINLGQPSSVPADGNVSADKGRDNAMMDMLGILFDLVMGTSEKKRVLEEGYKLPVSDYASSAMEGLGMTLTAEDFWQGRLDSMREDC